MRRSRSRLASHRRLERLENLLFDARLVVDEDVVRLPLNHWALAGEWTIGREKVVLEQAGGTIAYRFHARDAHLVLSPGAREPIPFRVLLDGEALNVLEKESGAGTRPAPPQSPKGWGS